MVDGLWQIRAHRELTAYPDSAGRFGLFLVCKNSYDVLQLFFDKHDYSSDYIYVLDLGSSPDQIELGKNICSSQTASFDHAHSSNMQDNIDQACDFFLAQGINWIFYCHQDVYPLTPDWRHKLSAELARIMPGNQGVVGINVYHDREINDWDPSSPRLMTTARAPLELGNGYYDSRPGSRVDYSKFEPDKPFLVETPFWSSCIIDITSFKRHINIDDNFMFFHAFDDMCFQFLQKNIPNFVLPQISFAHDQSMKLAAGKPKNSSTSGSEKEIVRLYGRFDHLSLWLSKWGFEYKVGKTVVGDSYFLARIIDRIERASALDLTSRLETIARKSFPKDGRYNGTLIEEFFNHDPRSGPFKYFNPMDFY